MSETDAKPPTPLWRRFFGDDQGNPSSMRLMSLLALAFSMVLAAARTWGSATVDTELVLYFLVAAFAPKAVQKFAERG